MLNDLKWVSGAVAKNNSNPALEHFIIDHGTIRAYNGIFAMSTTIALDIACKPNAQKMLKAVEACKSTAQFNITPTGRLSIKAGSFKAFVDCMATNLPHPLPSGKLIPIDGKSLMSAFRSLLPFVSDDDNHVWSKGILIKGYSAFATNNKILAECYTGEIFPIVLNIPGVAIKELLKLKEPPIRAQWDEGSVTFHFENNKWLRTQLLTTSWPDLSKILDKPSIQIPIDAKMFDELKTLEPFCNDIRKVIFSDSKISTHGDGEGASVEYGCNAEGAYNIDALLSLQNVVKTIDWSLYPKPALWIGENIRGAIVGMQK